MTWVSRVFTCRGCREIARLVGEVDDLRKLMSSMKMMVTGHGLEERGGETGDRVAGLEEAEEKCERDMPQPTFRQEKSGLDRRQQEQFGQKIGTVV